MSTELSRKRRRAAIAEKLRKAREGAGISQSRAAEKLGRPQSYVSRCETGAHRVDVVELEEFGRLYNKSIQFFLDGPG